MIAEAVHIFLIQCVGLPLIIENEFSNSLWISLTYFLLHFQIFQSKCVFGLIILVVVYAKPSDVKAESVGSCTTRLA